MKHIKRVHWRDFLLTHFWKNSDRVAFYLERNPLYRIFLSIFFRLARWNSRGRRDLSSHGVCKFIPLKCDGARRVYIVQGEHRLAASTKVMYAARPVGHPPAVVVSLGRGRDGKRPDHFRSLRRPERNNFDLGPVEALRVPSCQDSNTDAFCSFPFFRHLLIKKKHHVCTRE